jgi:hypothetical protein
MYAVGHDPFSEAQDGTPKNAFNNSSLATYTVASSNRIQMSYERIIA